ncbi:class A beta-lactamase [Paracoccus sp. Ld10]|uniref:class A beta-lactamase n=1 Tax=Paracoccus sp. Ld10 TaxID=649158 RepID=UPI00386F483B
MNRIPIAAAAVLVGCLAGPLAAETIEQAARAVEADLGGRVGVALRRHDDTETHGYRMDERFPLSSTFKVPLCGAILALVDAGEERLDRVIAYGADDLVTYSPVTELHVDDGMSVAQLCHATITQSDNSAGNLLLDRVGGPGGLTEYLRTIGDDTTRLDRWETDLNEATPGDPRDSTTPAQMIDTVEALVLGPVLSDPSRGQLEGWMQADAVADDLIRASLPDGWQIGDKTGAGGYGSRSIIAVIRPPQGDAWVASVYLTGNDADMATRNRAIARIGAAMVDTIGQP